MLDAIVRIALARRWLVIGVTLVAAAVGAFSFGRLTIDAVPDITNVQVQINTEAPGYTPLESEQRITFPIETALGGLPRLDYTRSLSRYGLSQVTVVFEDGTDIYLARQLVDQRLQEAKQRLPIDVETTMGPISTGFVEIFMWSINAKEGVRKPDGSAYSITDLR